MMNLTKRKSLGVAVMMCLVTAVVLAQSFFYMEVKQGDRIFVFGDQKMYQEFQKTGEVEKGIQRAGRGPGGETLIFDGEQAIHLYNFKHNLPDEVIAKPEAVPAPSQQEKPPYHFSGLVFGDYYYNAQRDDNIATLSNVASQSGPQGLNGFQFRRIFFTFDDDISEHFFTRFRLEADGTSLTSTGKITVAVKDAYLQWKNAFGNNSLIFGIQPPPAYDIAEDAWAYRSLEKTIMDLRGIVGARDFGVALKGKFDSDGKFKYCAMVGNNSNQSPEIDKYKRFYFNFVYKPNDKFLFTAYQDIKQNPQIVDPNNANNKLSNTAYTTAFFAGYGTKDIYGLGFEAFWQTAKNGDKTGAAPPYTVSGKTADGFSGWAWYNFNSRVGVVGRYDYFDPNTNSAFTGDSRNLVIAALVLKPYKSVWLMPNVEIESYQKLPDGTTYKNSVTPRFTFYYFYP